MQGLSLITSLPWSDLERNLSPGSLPGPAQPPLACGAFLWSMLYLKLLAVHKKPKDLLRKFWAPASAYIPAAVAAPPWEGGLPSSGWVAAGKLAFLGVGHSVA